MVRTSRTNQRGQEMGAKGKKTRQRFIAAARKLMETRPIRELTVADIVRESHSSIPTFYVYFEDVVAVALAVVTEMSLNAPDLAHHFAKPWGRNALRQAKAFVEDYLEYYNANHALFRARDHLGEDGDARFVEIRRRWGAPMVYALAQQIATKGTLAGAPIDPLPESASASSAILLAMVDRMGPILRQPMGPPGGGPDTPFGFRRAKLITATAELMVLGVRGALDAP